MSESDDKSLKQLPNYEAELVDSCEPALDASAEDERVHGKARKKGLPHVRILLLAKRYRTLPSFSKPAKNCLCSASFQATHATSPRCFARVLVRCASSQEWARRLSKPPQAQYVA